MKKLRLLQRSENNPENPEKDQSENETSTQDTPADDEHKDN